ncbi:MAG: hypothetical protein R6U96_03045 [Promethearchaeia archaeon]
MRNRVMTPKVIKDIPTIFLAVDSFNFFGTKAPRGAAKAPEITIITAIWIVKIIFT